MMSSRIQKICISYAKHIILNKTTDSSYWTRRSESGRKSDTHTPRK